ncbi:MAG TPA: DNA gyrase inhibitor YacG [Gammaproteobacteria bacterium]|nr:DNA gyrase inhibitor YacG [Gammaproteobacteria bacterium]
MRALQCPNCQKPVEWTSEFPFRPFCSERCRMLDLGAWADNRYSIPINAPVETEVPCRGGSPCPPSENDS